MKKLVKALGYIRVSTELKGQDEQALNRQAAKIREACGSRNFMLMGIDADIGSAVANDSANSRPGLRSVLKAAQQQDCIIIVVSASRLFRNLAEARKIMKAHYPRVFSIEDGGFLSRKRFLERVAQAERTAQAISVGTREAMKSKGSSGPSAEARLRGNRQSQAAERFRSDKLVLRIAEALVRDPGWRAFSHRQVADLLNQNGIRTSQGRVWTKGNVRRSMVSAREVLAEREEIESDAQGWELFAFPTRDPSPDRSPVVPAAQVSEDDGMDQLREIPTFGMF